MTATPAVRPLVEKPRVPLYYWPFWLFLLALGLIVFYGIFTPGWMAIRGFAWLSERTQRRPH